MPLQPPLQPDREFDPDTVLARDRHRLLSGYRRLRRANGDHTGASATDPGQDRPPERGELTANAEQGIQRGQDWMTWQAAVARSAEKVTRRLETRPVIRYPENLPIVERLAEIREALTRHQVIILAGETGSGKTTQLPKLCLELGRGSRGMIGHTQPRRLAARAVAERLAEELAVSLGKEVGFQVRFTDQTADSTLIKLMTDGILLAETRSDPWLTRYDTLIIDEAHERSLNIDFLLGFLKRLLPRRPDLKLIITSATIDLEKFSAHFGNAPILEVSGRTWPVEVRYRPLLRRGGEAGEAGEDETPDEDLTLQEGVLAALAEIEQEDRLRGRGPGDVLVFLTGERDIRELAQLMRRANLRDTEILPLYARLGAAEQAQIFRAHSGRRVVLATNVAETSLTVPGIRYVIDTGLARISRYSHRSKVQRLPIEPISQASAEQRKGRCGRVAEGICIRLYSEEDYAARPAFTDPEILRTNLAAVILQMHVLKLGAIDNFPFLQRPQNALINDGRQVLREIRALDEKDRLLPEGRQIARFPTDPRLARILLESARFGALDAALIVVSALASQDPRERPHDKQQAAEERHAQWADEHSDFTTLLNLWKDFEGQRQALSSKAFRVWCKKNFLSFLRLREWRENHRQFLLICQETGLRTAPPAGKLRSGDPLHRAILSGFLTQVGQRDERREYRSTRQRRFELGRGTTVRKKPPPWVVAVELVETTRLYARMVGQIEPEWIEDLGEDLLKSTWLEPHWSRKRGEVCAWLQKSLYGLIIVARRRVSYGRVDPAVARQIFIREALVEGEVETRADFVSSNQQCRAELARLEEKTRRRDLLVSEDELYDFYDARIPEEVCTVRGLEAWYRGLDTAGKRRLILTEADLLREPAAALDTDAFPDTLEWRSQRFPVEYQFAPGEQGDGINLRVPLALLPQLPLRRLEWVVPGLLKEKIEGLLRSLPKSLRKQFVPLPEYAAQLAASLTADNVSLTDAMAERLQQLTGKRIPPDAWRPETLAQHLRVNLQVCNGDGEILDQDRDYHALYGRLEAQIAGLDAGCGAAARGTAPVAGSAGRTVQDGGLHERQREERYTSWAFGDLPEAEVLSRGGMQYERYPVLLDGRDHVRLGYRFDALTARHESIDGLSRLFLLTAADTARHISRNLPEWAATSLLYAPIGKSADLLDDFMLACAREHFLGTRPLPRSEDAFRVCLRLHRQDWMDRAENMAKTLHAILLRLNGVQRQLASLQVAALQASVADARSQLLALLQPGFLRLQPWEWVACYPRYLAALEIRLDKMPRQITLEQRFLSEIQPLWAAWESRRLRHEQEGVWDPELEQFRWMLEEYRVSVFAQTLGTGLRVSIPRLEAQFQRVRR